MSVWVCIPSARPAEEVAKWAQAWRVRGYKIALWRDNAVGAPSCDILGTTEKEGPGEYPGYAKAVNSLVAHAMDQDPEAEWFIIGGDDVYPDPNHTAEEIARECGDHFGGPEGEYLGSGVERTQFYRTFGVMQPTGDRWGVNPDHPNPAMRSAYIDRVCGSAWIGREFARRINQGKGPLWPEYQHMFVDAELQAVATKLGVLWQRPDLIQMHNHASRAPRYNGSLDCPPHLRKWTIGEEGRKHWRESEDLYNRRERAGFLGSEPL